MMFDNLTEQHTNFTTTLRRVLYCGYCKNMLGEEVPVRDISVVNDTLCNQHVSVKCKCHGSTSIFTLHKDYDPTHTAKKILFPSIRKCFKLPINSIGYSQLEFGDTDIIIRNNTNNFYLILDKIYLRLVYEQDCIVTETAIQRLCNEKPIDNGLISYIKNHNDARLYKLPDNCLNFKAVLLSYESGVNSDWQRMQSVSLLHESNYWLKFNSYNVHVVNYARQHLYDITAQPID